MNEKNEKKDYKKVATRKAVKVIGKQEYINAETGEIKIMDVVSIEDRDANFHKIWIYHLAEALDLIGNQKTKILFHIMENLNKENQYIGSQRTMAKKLKMSTQTVSLTMIALQEADVITVVQGGVYQVNPDMIYKGGKEDRMNMLIEYHKTKSENNTKKQNKNTKNDKKEPQEPQKIDKYLNNLD